MPQRPPPTPQFYAFNCYMLFLFYFLSFNLRNIQLQNTIFKLTVNVFFRDILAYIKASAHGTCITLLTKVLALLISLILVKSLGSGYCQISVFQLNLDFVFFKSGQIDYNLIAVIHFPDISFHYILCVFPVKLLINIRK